MSGASAFRPSYQAMIQAAQRREFDVLISEAMDRLSRDQGDIAHLFKLLTFAGVKIVTHSEGEINELHVGLKGTMNALFLKDLSQKTHRGLRGRVEAGKSTGGQCYGYRPDRRLSEAGELICGDRRIEPSEALVVQRMFQMFADGSSSIAIAKQLNAEGIPGPRGKPWQDTTIRGRPNEGTGMLHNQLYVGRQRWARTKTVKDPSTGKRVSRKNPVEDWVTHDVPELRIVDETLWQRVQERITAMRNAAGVNDPERNAFWTQKRPKHLLTGKTYCGVCGGIFSGAGSDLLACLAAKRQGTCTNARGIRRAVVEETILNALRDQLMSPEDVAVFVSEFTVEWNRLQAQASATNSSAAHELQIVDRKLSGLCDAIADGFRTPGLQQKLEDLEARKADLMAKVSAKPVAAPRLHPNLAEIYRKKVVQLEQTFRSTDGGTAALEAVRGLVDRVIVHPKTADGTREIELVGEIAAMVSMAIGRQNLPNSADDLGLFESSVKVIAGTHTAASVRLAGAGRWA